MQSICWLQATAEPPLRNVEQIFTMYKGGQVHLLDPHSGIWRSLNNAFPKCNLSRVSKGIHNRNAKIGPESIMILTSCLKENDVLVEMRIIKFLR